MEIENKKEIVKQIEKLNKKKLIELFKKIVQLDVKYTKNKNGIFIDLNNCTEYQLKCVEDYLNDINING